HPRPTLFPYTTLFRSADIGVALTTVEGETAFFREMCERFGAAGRLHLVALEGGGQTLAMNVWIRGGAGIFMIKWSFDEKYSQYRSEEHTSELQSLAYL